MRGAFYRFLARCRVVRAGESNARMRDGTSLSDFAPHTGFHKNESGAVTVEYVIVIFGSIALALAVIASISGSVWSLSSDIDTGLQNANVDLSSPSGEAGGSGSSDSGAGSDTGNGSDSGSDSGSSSNSSGGGDTGNGAGNGNDCTGNCGAGNGNGGGNGTENEGKGKGKGKDKGENKGKHNY